MFVSMMVCTEAMMVAMFLAARRPSNVPMVFFTTPVVGVAQCRRKNSPSHHQG
jgi:hypothetical protein